MFIINIINININQSTNANEVVRPVDHLFKIIIWGIANFAK